MAFASTTGMKCFHTCLSVCSHLWGYPYPADRGDPNLANQGGCTRGVPPSFMTGEYPIWLTGRGVPQGGTLPVGIGWVYSLPLLGLDGYLPSGLDGGTPCQDWMGYPPPPSGLGGGTPCWESEQQSKHLLHSGRYASSVYAERLSCLTWNSIQSTFHIDDLLCKYQWACVFLKTVFLYMMFTHLWYDVWSNLLMFRFSIKPPRFLHTKITVEKTANRWGGQYLKLPQLFEHAKHFKVYSHRAIAKAGAASLGMGHRPIWFFAASDAASISAWSEWHR